jgi:hypothetical protein
LATLILIISSFLIMFLLDCGRVSAGGSSVIYDAFTLLRAVRLKGSLCFSLLRLLASFLQ